MSPRAPHPAGPRLLNVAQVAELLGLHPETIRHMARRGQLPALKLGGRTSPYRFRESAIDAHLAALERRYSRRHGGDAVT
jgi:excisionase family DNA binding protein